MISMNSLRGGTRLSFDLVEGVTRTVEAMHETIARHPLPWSATRDTPTGAHGMVAAAVYGSIRGTNAVLREGTDALWRLVPASAGDAPKTDEEIRALAVLNGVLGDHLEATGNTLGLPMCLLHDGRRLPLDADALRDAVPDAGRRVVVLVHGLCLSELCWQRENRSDLGALLSSEPDTTTLHLRYNSGRHISSNGRELAGLLERLHAAWPVAIESLTLIGHSMGGLVIRSACWYADAARSEVLRTLRHVVCLGTPHHGSMVERAGHAFDLAIRQYPYLSPLAVGRHRSAGIKDLHHGDLLDEDWRDHDPEAPRADRRRPVPLLPEVEYYLLAAVVGDSEDHALSALFGDLLVRADSATGAHGEADKRLPVPAANCRIFAEKNHFDLLTDARVHEQIVKWLRHAAP